MLEKSWIKIGLNVVFVFRCDVNGSGSFFDVDIEVFSDNKVLLLQQ